MEQFLADLCQTYAVRENFSGVCRLDQRGNVLFEGAYGYANRTHMVLNTVDTMFDTASITKVFTATAILQLAESGKLGLSERVTDIVDLTGTRIPREVTIAHLLNHTSGIADDADEEAGEDYTALFIDRPNYAVRECRDFLPSFVYKAPNFKAGTDVRYCNCAFILLGLAIERITGQLYREYVTREIFKRAGMLRSGFFAMDEIHRNTAEGYQSIFGENGQITGYKKNIYSYPPIGTADGGALTTCADLSLFFRSIHSGTLLSKAYEDIFFKPHCGFITAVDYGIPDMIKVNGYALEFLLVKDEIVCIYKDGCNAGAAGMVCYYPKQDMVLSILANQDCDVWKLQRTIQQKIYNLFRGKDEHDVLCK